MSKKLNVRIETDSIGAIEVPKNKYWGAQTQRAVLHFDIGNEPMPLSIIKAYGIIKKAAALANNELKLLPKKLSTPIIKAADEIIQGKLNEHFPLHVWQSGSGTQTNMNVNEVLSNRSIELMGGKLGSKRPIHPNDHVNMCQSTNDTFPSAMRIATAIDLKNLLIPALKQLKQSLSKKQKTFKNIIKVGRTHLQDAVPLTLGQEFSGYVSQLEANINRLTHSLNELYRLPLGGTAVGTGLNAHHKFGQIAIKKIASITKLPFKPAHNKFAMMAAHDELVFLSSTLKTLAVSLTKISNDIRWMGSGPRCGLNELTLPSNEPGSSIMPGKVNPSQCEMLLMVCAQVIGNDATIAYAGSQGNFELNVYKPIIIYNLLQSIDLLAQAMKDFTRYLVTDLKANRKQIKDYVEHSLMLITALAPKIGYDKAANIAKYAHENHISLKQACLDQNLLTAKTFDQLVDIKKMV